MSSNIVLNSNLKLKCQRCAKNQIITDIDSGEVFCGYCGMVINSRLENFGYDSNHIDNKTDTRRTGASRTLSRNDFGLSTIIGTKNIDSKGNTIPSSISHTIKRIRIQDTRSQLSKNSDMNFKNAFYCLELIKEKLGVSENVKETAAYIYRKAVERKITTGRQINSVVAASMYIACRNTQTLRSLKEISDATDIKRKKISQSYRAIVKQLDLKIPLVNQTDYILKISNNLKISPGTKNLAIEILKKAAELDMMAGREPAAMAAASVYYSNAIRNERFTQIQIAHASGVTAVTLRNRFHEIKEKIQIQKDRNSKNLIVFATCDKLNSFLKETK